MRPTTAILLVVSLPALAAPARARAEAPDAGAALAAQAATPSAEAPAQDGAPQKSAPADPAGTVPGQPLPLAKIPEPSLVPAGISIADPKPTAARALEGPLVASKPPPPEDVPDDPAMAEEIDKDSAELEAIRKAEEASHVAEVAPHAPGEGRIELIPELDHDVKQLQAEYDIPIDVNEAVVQYIRFFQSRAVRPHFVKWLGRSHRYMDVYRNIMKEEGLPEDTVFLAMIESGFGNFAYSRAKASGPWQFIGATGKYWGLRQDFWVDERRDPEKSAHAAARYLKKLYEQTGDWRLAWAGYNAGVGRIFKARQKGYDDFWSMAAVPGKKILRPETKGYVPKLMAAAIIAKHPEDFGFKAEEIEAQSWTEYEEATIPSATLLAVIARAADVSERELIDLNPELRRACTPPVPYRIKIPKGQAETFAENWPALAAKARMSFAGHVVRRGDTVAGIARRYGVPVQGVLEMNGLHRGRHLRVGTELLIPKPIGGGSLAAARAPAEAVRRPDPTVRARTVAAAAVAPQRTRSTLRVKPGETLWSISRRLNVDLDDLCRWNGIGNPHRHKLLAGARLVVYDEGG